MEPATAAAIVSSAMEYLKDSRTASWQASVSSKLDQILQNIAELKSEFVSLKIWIDEHDLAELQKSLDEEINVYRHQVSQIMANNDNRHVELKSTEGQRLLAILDPLKHAVGKATMWKRYGFVSYQIVLAGSLTSLYIMELLSVKRAERKSFLTDQITEYWSHALDPTDVRSVRHARDQFAKLTDDSQAEIDSRINRWWLTNLQEYRRQHKTPDGFQTDTFTVGKIRFPTGSIEQGYTCEQTNTVGDDSFRNYAWYPGLRHFDIGDGEVSKIDILNDLASRRHEQQYLRDTRNLLTTYLSEIEGIIAQYSDLARRY